MELFFDSCFLNVTTKDHSFLVMEFRKPDMGTFLINEQPKQVSVRVILGYWVN